MQPPSGRKCAIILNSDLPHGHNQAYDLTVTTSSCWMSEQLPSAHVFHCSLSPGSSFVVRTPSRSASNIFPEFCPQTRMSDHSRCFLFLRKPPALHLHRLFPAVGTGDAGAQSATKHVHAPNRKPQMEESEGSSFPRTQCLGVRASHPTNDRLGDRWTNAPCTA